MANAIFDQRPKQFTSFGYPGSRFVQRIQKQGYAAGSVVTCSVFSFNAAGEVSDPIKADLQPDIQVVDTENVLLVLTGPQTREYRDPAYFFEYSVDGTVRGVSLHRFTRTLATDAEALLAAEKIVVTAGADARLILRNPEAEDGYHGDYTTTQAVNGQFIPHNLNTDLLESFAYTSAGVRRTDVGVIPLRGEAGKDFKNWGYLFLPPVTDADDRIVDLIIKPLYR